MGETPHCVGFHMDVALIRFPGDEDRRAALLASGRPVLLLVATGSPPTTVDPLEDWIRVPACEEDLEARLESLRLRAQRFVGRADRRQPVSVPSLEDGGVLRYGTDWVPLSPLEARLVATLIERMGNVVTRRALIESGWPERQEPASALHRGALDAQIARLRRRLSVIGLTVRTVRSRGYALDPLPTRHQEAPLMSTSGL